MSTVKYIKGALDFAHAALADARNGTDDQLHFIPEHGSHSIAWCLWHTTRIEDLLVNMRFKGGPPVWNQEWADRTGLPFDGFGTNMSDEDAQAIRIRDIAAFQAYQEAVWASTDAYLASVSDEDLERELPSRSGPPETIAQAISLHMVGHFNGHRGEINTLRGMQGMPTVMAAQGTH